MKDLDGHTIESPGDLPKSRGTGEYKTVPVAEALKLLSATMGGLAESEAGQRLTAYGRNEVLSKKRHPVIEFLSRFWGPMPWLLETAIVLSVVLKHHLEAVIIAALIVVNAVIGYRHHQSSQKSLELLKKRLAIKARLLRDGEWVALDAESIVPGDIMVVQMGDIVPADAKIVSGELSIDQSALTGESLPVEARDSGIIYASSIVKRGQARCLVVNTGGSTYFGKTAELVKIARPESRQEQTMLSVVRYMMYLGIGALILVAIDALVLKTPVVTVATFAAIFLIGAVPVALPAVLTIVQSVGAMELVKKGVLVTRLDSIEDAASIDILCLDKTGTLTMNQLAIGEVIPFPGYDKDDVLRIAALTAKPESKDTIDAAISEYAKAIGVDLSSYRQISVTPFEPTTRLSEGIIQDGNSRFRAVKGAPQVVLSLCRKTSEVVLKSADQTVVELSQKGYRTLAVAKSEGDRDDLELVALLALVDPPRPDAASMIAEMRNLGIKPIMITGDNIAIAREVATQVGIGDRIIRASELKGLSEPEQTRMVEECDGLAEVYPEDKYRIVKLLQSQGHMVGMTGDGVNDAPALKQAEIGIAVSGATDVAKASASIVLIEPGIRVIIEALKTSRQIYQRMLTWVVNKVTKTIQFVGLLVLGFFWLHELVLSLLGMALLVFANDFVTMSLATDNVKTTSNPNKWNVKNITLSSAIMGIFFIIEGWLAILIGKDYFHLATAPLLSFILLMLIFTSQFRIYIVRERRHFWDSRPSRTLLISSIAAMVAFAVLGISGIAIAKLTLYQVLFALGLSAILTLGIDLPKYHAFRKFGL